MNWLNFFKHKTELYHHFGKAINADISPDEEELFNSSYEAFEKKKTLDAYQFFLESLQNFRADLQNNNLVIDRDEKTIKFELYQGTAKIVGTITKENFYAEVILVKAKDANVALKRYILERNYQLTYGRYFSDNNYIKLKIFHDNITMSPHKIFFPIRELALNADFDKEHIKSEFQDIELEDIEHIQKIDDSELKIKFNYMKLWIEDADAKVLTLPSNDNSNMQAFIYLNLLFKIDYLLVPRFNIYQKMNKKILAYFSEESGTLEFKNEELKRYVNQLKEMEYEEYSQNFYNAKYTFNPIEKTSHDDIVNFISESLLKIRWYKNNRYNQIIPTIYNYIAFYSLYNYGLNQPTRDLFHLLIEVQNPHFFEELGYSSYYDSEKESF
ncbi:MAG: hypothetical protein U9P38_00575, partial [Campylobacterota bacterium]|nr:hypothetical protein [Campylobacterota bacterium]